VKSVAEDPAAGTAARPEHAGPIAARGRYLRRRRFGTTRRKNS
jgi:hypothetical protein